jgi:hypothetical protein
MEIVDVQNVRTPRLLSNRERIAITASLIVRISVLELRGLGLSEDRSHSQNSSFLANRFLDCGKANGTSCAFQIGKGFGQPGLTGLWAKAPRSSSSPRKMDCFQIDR